MYTLLIVGVGLYSARFARRSDEDYFLAGRGLGPWVAARSASASSESGWVTLGLIGWAFTTGVSAYWIIPGCLAGFLFTWLIPGVVSGMVLAAVLAAICSTADSQLVVAASSAANDVYARLVELPTSTFLVRHSTFDRSAPLA